jgi:hypothetical protein
MIVLGIADPRISGFSICENQRDQRENEKMSLLKRFLTIFTIILVNKRLIP